MSIDIDKIAKLSKLAILDEERETFKNKLDSILEMINDIPDDKFVNKNKILDKDDIMVLREDEICKSTLTRDELLKNSNNTQAGCIVVPKVLE